MSDDSRYHSNQDLAVFAFIGLLVGFAAGSLLGMWSGGVNVRKEAVKAGVARWVAAEDGDSKFEWIVPTEKRQ